MYARIQENGQVTIPAAIRRKLNLRKGSLVAFVETEGGVLMKPPEVIFMEALQEIGEALKAEGMTLEEWIERGREIRGKIIEEKYGLREEG